MKRTSLQMVEVGLAFQVHENLTDITIVLTECEWLVKSPKQSLPPCYTPMHSDRDHRTISFSEGYIRDKYITGIAERSTCNGDASCFPRFCNQMHQLKLEY